MPFLYFCSMIKKLSLTGAFAIFTLLAAAQYYHGGMSGSLHFPGTQFTVDSAGNIRFVPGDMGFSLEAGAGYTNYGGSSLFSTWSSPAAAYNLSERFRLKGGVTLYHRFPDHRESVFAPYPISGTRVFVSGDYLVNHNLMISGTVFRDFSLRDPAVLNDQVMKNKGYEGMILNLEYSPAKNVKINASFEYSNRPAFYHPNPFHHHSPFSPGYGW